MSSGAPDPHRLAELVRAYLRTTELSQASFAEQAGVSPASVSRLLGRSPASLSPSSLGAMRAAVPAEFAPAPSLDLGPSDGRTLRVFLSSTYHDLAQRREDVMTAVEGFDELKCIAMERWTASTRPSVESCLEAVRACDLYLGVVAYRYGWIPPGQPAGEERSITELEYEEAVRQKKPRLLFLVDESKVRIDPTRDVDDGHWEEGYRRLRAFKDRLRADVMPALFHSNTDLVQKVNQALRAWLEERRPAVVAPAVREFTPDDEALDRYRAAALAEHRYLPTVGFPTTFRVEIELDDLFVPLRAVPLRSGEDPAERILEGARAHADDELPFALAPESLDSAATSLAPTVFSRARDAGRGLVVVTGLPGSGKTSLGRRLTNACLTHDPEPLLGLALPRRHGSDLGERSLVPLFLPLKLVDADQLELPPHEVLARHLPLEPPFAERLLARGSVLLYLDGLDEVAADLRLRVATWCRDLANRLPSSFVVVSARPAGYRDEVRAALEPNAFQVETRPFDRDQSESFIRRWYAAIERASRKSDWEERASHSAADLIARLRRQERAANQLLALTANPLLLTVMCLVHRDKGSYLPEDQVRLYGEASEVLLEHWRRVNTGETSLTAVQSRVALGPVACFLHESERRSATLAELEPVLREPLGRVAPELTPNAFLSLVRDESGILCGHGPDEWGFLHLAFQEYFCAYELRERFRRWGFRERRRAEALLTTLARRFGASWWQQVFRLLFALPDEPHLFDDVLTELIEHRLDDVLDLEPEIEICQREAKGMTLEPFARLVDGQLTQPEADDEDDLVRIAVRRLLYAEAGRALVLEQDRADRIVSAAPLDVAKLVVPFAEKQGLAHARGLRRVLDARIDSESDTPAPRVRVRQASKGGISWVEIPKGVLTRTSEPVDSFWLAQTPITNEQYQRFVEETGHPAPPAWREERWSDPRQPVVTVSWEDANAFCTWAGGVRLPTELEWEYACRAGSEKEYWFGNDEAELEKYAWYRKNSGGVTHPVGQKPPNPWGLFDMLGNVWEWCEDRYTEDDDWRVVRGGSWRYDAWGCRSAYRNHDAPGFRDVDLGFRPALITTG